MAKVVDKKDSPLATVASSGLGLPGQGHYYGSVGFEADNAGAGPTGTAKVQGSNDGVNWNDVGNVVFAGNGFKYVELAQKAYKFFRWDWSGVNNLRLKNVYWWLVANNGTL